MPIFIEISRKLTEIWQFKVGWGRQNLDCDFATCSNVPYVEQDNSGSRPARAMRFSLLYSENYVLFDRLKSNIVIALGTYLGGCKSAMSETALKIYRKFVDIYQVQCLNRKCQFYLLKLVTLWTLHAFTLTS